MSEIIATVREIRVGRPKAFARNQVSGIDKQPVPGIIAVGPTGLEGDGVGDPRYHGGADKALHCYAQAHYAYWQRQFPANPHFRAGGFGENLCIEGTDEWQVCLGDQWQIGTARFEVSQGRQPCWKLNERFEIADMAERVQHNLRCGWYLRVLQTGGIQAGDSVALLSRPFPDWPLVRILALIDSRSCDETALREVLALPLPASWRQMFERRLETGVCEDWQRRLYG
ncbi:MULTISPECIES: MOSC domain-containing protein [Eikenella]|uniref:Molybdenum cofactor biosysynthesis protein n=1 Tax=Eikenella longinqua TaxID=1795827 RepID=A0A1A9RVW2_9NEIS|nr:MULTISPECIES: MOSC domain-containing protein [Eikenella]OAM26738.1 molybdenum cofactor biosysynthesis protein [Eikenella longinqua]